MAFNWNGAAYDITMSLSFRKWKKNVTHSTFTRFHGNMLKAYTVSCTGWAEVVDVCRPQRDERFGFPGRVLYLNWIEVHARSRSASDSVHVIRSVRGKLNYRWVFWLARAKEEHKCSSHFLPFVLSLGGGGAWGAEVQSEVVAGFAQTANWFWWGSRLCDLPLCVIWNKNVCEGFDILCVLGRLWEKCSFKLPPQH